MTDTTAPAPQDLPAFTGRRLLYAATGALTAAHTPFWVNWVRLYYPEVSVRMLVTRSAERFVTRQALASLSGTDVMVDGWPEDPAAEAPHVELAEWADTFVVTPATLGFCSRLAAGLTDSPLLLALQCTRAPVALAPSLPPGGAESVAYRRALSVIGEMPHVTVVPPVPGLSATTGRWDATINPPLPAVFAAAEALRGTMAAAEPGGRT
ncbi:flavoprotein [Streptomyces sp. NRRL F-5650]|jgi:phosphopantothenoylcysteine decarboxylase/phosphopantothenate--cysteine ligase|uniref:flavoprotein n=1 Tax=Streptomyces sp. NRRL F-5650 TaxID=1463868 RepID=UPI00056BE4CF|nr:flavoprotein [Streptomyces sp. NRRL F-5650]